MHAGRGRRRAELSARQQLEEARGRPDDLVGVGEEIVLGDGAGHLPEVGCRRGDGLGGLHELLEQRPQLRDEAVRWRSQQRVQAREHLARFRVQRAQRRLDGRAPRVLDFLEQHLAVADDVPERRAQLVPRVGEGGQILLVHSEAFGPRNPSIFPKSLASSIGLVS